MCIALPQQSSCNIFILVPLPWYALIPHREFLLPMGVPAFLEVGIGKDCRLMRRGLYGRTLEQLRQSGVSKLELKKALDITSPVSIIEQPIGVGKYAILGP